MPEPNDGGTARPEKLDNLVQLIQILLGLDVVLAIVFGVHKLKFRGKADVGFVEWDEEEREDLVDIDEENGRLPVEL